MTFNDYIAQNGDGLISQKERSFPRTKEAKAQRLGLSDNDIKRLKSLKVKRYAGSINENDFNTPTLETIDLDKLVGYAYHSPENWYDALDDSVFHKLINLDRYDPKLFPTFICREHSDMPCVIEKNRKYYIFCGGNHRLTIAKITGCKKARVLVFREK